ncbi:hypothetical protein APASM_3859 [Actinosynnema pretiosum subsp. pretiosum]|nr:hypothetical protein APASM_3859 [Actinosynnema pretiosum subsp. pretiosum]
MQFGLTPVGRDYLRGGDDGLLAAALHANIRFFGEILAELGDGLTHVELQAVAKEKYGLEWRSLDQIRRRVYWLRATGMVDYWTNNKILLTDRGRELLGRLDLVDPAELTGPPVNGDDVVDLAEAPPMLAQRLAELDQEQLAARSRVVGYVAGGTNIETINVLVAAVLEPVPRARFVRLCVETFQVAESSGEQTLNTLRSLGLIDQVGPDAFSATAVAAEWVSSGDPLDFVRILHSKVALVGELLTLMSGAARASEITKALASSYATIRLSRDEVTRRLAFLSEAGLVERLGNSIRRTALGAAFAGSVPLLATALEPQAADRADVVSAASRADVLRLRERLVETSVDSGNFKRFEETLVEAFRALGVDVERHGGAGRTDLLVSLWVSPTEQIRIAVEAKTDGGGVVTEQDVKFDALAEHRTLHDARVTLLVGPGFSNRLVQWAADKDVVLVTAVQLADMLARHAGAPLYPHEFMALLGDGDDDAHERVWRRLERRQSVIAHLLDIMWKSANDPVDIEYGEGALGVREIWRESKRLLDVPMDKTEIQEALALLSTPFLSAVATSGQNHVATTSPDAVAARLRSLADMIDNRGRPAIVPPVNYEPRRSTTPETPPRPGEPDVNPADVRAWALANGRGVSQRGRLSTRLIQEFLADSN